MSKNLSISQRLKKAKSPAVKAEIVNDWANGWRAEQEALVQLLDRAARDGDWSAVVSAKGQLHEVTVKRFAGLPAVLDHLLAYEGEVEDRDGKGAHP